MDRKQLLVQLRLRRSYHLRRQVAGPAHFQCEQGVFLHIDVWNAATLAAATKEPLKLNRITVTRAVLLTAFTAFLVTSNSARTACADDPQQGIMFTHPGDTSTGQNTLAVAPPGVAASINGEEIPISVVTKIALQLAGPDVLNNLIDNAVIDQDAKRRGIVVAPSEIDAQVDSIRRALQPNTLDDMLKKRHMTLDELRDTLRIQLEVAKPLLKTLPTVSTESSHAQSQNVVNTDALSQVQERQIEARAPQYVEAIRDKAKIQIYLGTNSTGPAGVAATVNGEDIMTSKVSDLALRMAGASITDRIIVNQLIDQDAGRQGITVNSAEIDASLAQTRSEIRPKTIEELLKQRHMSMGQFRDDVRVTIEADKLVLKSIGPMKMAHVETILIATQGSAPLPHRARTVKSHSESQARAIMETIQRELKSGLKFEDLARRYSDDPESGRVGGDIGIVPNSTFIDPSFTSAVTALGKGQITSQPIKTAYGLQLIKVVSTSFDFSPTDGGLYASAERRMEPSALAMFEPGYIESLRKRGNVINYLSK